MDESKIKKFPKGTVSTNKEASRRLDEMMELLDHLQEEASANWPPLDRHGQPMRIGISTCEPIIPLVESEADWDRATVEREDLFERRFGFAWPHRYREDLMRLKHERELTDREIKLLHLTGHLYRHRTEVRLTSNGPIALMGGLFIAAMMMMLLMVFLGLLVNPSLSWFKVIAAVAFSLFLLGVSWGAHKFYILPWQIYRRSR